jgi:dolichyl-phosphate beta-glucosyltransferase
MARDPHDAAILEARTLPVRTDAVPAVGSEAPPRAAIERTPDHDLTVVVPAYNEELRLPGTLDGLSAFLEAWGIDYRVLVVDDGSDDSTRTLTANRGPRFSTIIQPRSGKGAAVRSGMLAATGRVVAFTDADLPYELSALRAGYLAIEAGNCDVVFGARDLKDSAVRAQRKILRTMAHLAFRAVVRGLVSSTVTDTQCGLKIFKQSAARQLFALTQVKGFAFDAEVVFLTHRLGLRFLRVPVVLINEYSSTISLSRHALPMLADVIRVRLRALGGGYDLAPRVGRVEPGPVMATRERAAA